ncbi:MAG TPA: hypothetical protein QGF58_12105 [Myxococcota bacterium]|nr:hypothetical protein [Myxococcota bacterium]
MVLSLLSLSLAQDPLVTEREPVDLSLLETAPSWSLPQEEDPPVEGELEEPVHSTAIPVPGLELEIHVPDPADGFQVWGWTVNDATMDTRVGMRNSSEYTDVVFSATFYQPDLTKLGGEIVEQILPMDDEDLEITAGELQRFEHEELGEVLYVNAHIWDGWLERDLWSQTVVFNVKGGAVIIRATSSDTLERADSVLASVLEMAVVLEPPIPELDLPYGSYEAEAGYTVEIPTGLRALTEEEAPDSKRISGDGPFTGLLATFHVVDPAQLNRSVFDCEAVSGAPLEVLDPAKSTDAVENFKTAMRVVLKGGKYRLESSGDEQFVDLDTTVPLYAKVEDEVRFIELAHREAFLWRVQGEVFEEPVHASVFYTAYDDIGLLCKALAEDGDEAILGTFEATMTGVEIREGELHPMPMSLASRYKRWWPWKNPLLQIYWLPVPLFLVAGWLVIRDDD